MKTRGLILAALHLILTLSVAGKFLYDRQTLPRVWVKAAPFDPSLPIRGRYVRIRVDATPGTGWTSGGGMSGVTLRVAGGQLLADRKDGAETIGIYQGFSVRLTAPLAYFIPATVADPSRRAPDEELWAEITVPPSGAIRPIRLGVKKNGTLTPLPLN
ncbi:MAG: hypothetical protein JNK87_36390 [Bryobacterales bacterium]|nr:hypothetical protein [Bryobacterales bacterium]